MTIYGLIILLHVPAVFSRLRLHEGKVIKDRRHHLRTYPNCFVGRELVDWLLDHKEASDRNTAVRIMQRLLDQSIIHHGEAPIPRVAVQSPTPRAVLCSQQFG